MRIGFVSDLHTDFNRQYDFVTVLQQLINDERLDKIVIMGDSANDLKRNLRFMNGWKTASQFRFTRWLVTMTYMWIIHVKNGCRNPAGFQKCVPRTRQPADVINQASN